MESKYGEGFEFLASNYFARSVYGKSVDSKVQQVFAYPVPDCKYHPAYEHPRLADIGGVVKANGETC
jgi:hypothetical protein